MIRRITLLCFALIFFVVGTAAAQNFWVGSVFNDFLGSKVPNVMGFDWVSSGSGNAQGVGPAGSPLTPGQQFNFRYQSYLFALTDPNGQPVNFPGLNSSFEYTVVALLPEEVVSFTSVGSSSTALFKTLAGGQFFIYHDASPNANVGTGFGFDDGELVASGTIDVNSFSSFTFTPSSNQGIGSAILTGNVTFANPAFLDPSISIVSLRLESTINFPPLDSTTSTYFAGRTGQGNLPSYSVASGDLTLKVDASSKFMESSCTGSIGDFVWHDLDRNGLQDAGEPGIDGVTVNLRDAANAIIATTTTGVGPMNQHGYYQFINLCAGEYRVEVITPAGFSPTTPCSMDQTTGNDSNCSPATVNLPDDNSSNQTIDFGFVTPCTGSIGDFVWHDLDRNGLQDAGEPGIDGVTVNLRDAANVIIATTTTSVGPGGLHGYYQFTGLCAGDYTVEVVTPAGFSPTTPCSANQTTGNDSNCSPAPVNLPDDTSSNQTIDFGFVTPCTGSIGDFVWHDLDRNGLQDAGEPGIDGVTVNLRDAANVIIATTTTSVGPGGLHGYYQFTGLCAGDYTVEVVTPAGFSPTTPCSANQTTGNDSNCSPAPVNLPNDTSSNQTIDFGFVTPCTGSIGDFVWHDLDRNGLQDVGEPGIDGVTVNLRDAANTIIATTTTSVGPGGLHGYYQFTGLCAGDYTVEVVTPAGFSPTTPCSANQTTGNDSNCSPAPVNLPNDTSSNQTIDFGFVTPEPCIDIEKEISVDGGTTWLDADTKAAAALATAPHGAMYRLIVKNCGTVGLTDVVVSDPTLGVEHIIGNLAAGAMVTLTSAQIPALNQAQRCSVPGDYPNTAIVTGQDASGFEVSDSDAAWLVCAPPPCIDIEKEISVDGGTTWLDADTKAAAALATAPHGAMYRLIVKNCGTVNLTDVVVTDPTLGVNFPIGNLAAGAMVTLTSAQIPALNQAQRCSVPGDYPNTAIVTGQDASGFEVSDSDAAWLVCAPPPCIDIEKEISVDGGTTWLDADTKAAAALATAPHGAMYRLIVKNCGTVNLTDVVVTDPTLGVNFLIGNLAAGAMVTLTSAQIPALNQAQRCGMPGDYPNTATVTGQDASGFEVSDSDAAWLVCAPPPCIDIEKEISVDGGMTWLDADTKAAAALATAPHGAMYRLIVKNCGTVDLTDVVVTDPTLGVNFPIGNLAAGAMVTLTSAQIPALNQPQRCGTPGDFPNTATVTGKDAGGVSVTDSDDAWLVCTPSPSIDIEKHTNGQDADVAPGPTIMVGSVVTWEYIVTNTGNITLSNVMVTDDKIGVISCPKTVLAPGESMICTKTGTAMEGQYENDACVEGTTPGNMKVTDCDPSHYKGVKPSIDVEKYVSKDKVNWFDADTAAEALKVPVCTQTQPDCQPCSGGITTLTLLYKGSYSKTVTVKDSAGSTLYSATVAPNTSFTFSGKGEGNTMGQYIKIYVGGTYTPYMIYTDCSKPVYPGAIFGCFTVKEGSSRYGGKLCPKPSSYSDSDDDSYCSDKDSYGDSSSCSDRKGYVTKLSLLHKGSKTSKVKVVDKDGRTLHDAYVKPNSACSFSGKDSNGTLTSYVKVYVDGVYHSTFYTDGSKDVYPGVKCGTKFTVVEGHSQYGGKICPKPSYYSSYDDDHYSKDYSCNIDYDNDRDDSSCNWSGSHSYDDDHYGDCDKDHDGDCDDHDGDCDTDHDGDCDDHDRDCGNDHDGDCSTSCKVFFKFVVTNTGNETLTGITLTDSVYNLSQNSCTPPNQLAPGATFECIIGPFASAQGLHTNTATATGTFSGTTVTDTDDANYYGCKATGVGTPGYWKNHPEAWPVDSIIIGGKTYTKTEAIAWMSKSVTDDKTITLFKALVAAKLNVLTCNESCCIADIIAKADAWMAAHPVGSYVSGSSYAWKEAEPYYLKLDAYNNGKLCAKSRDYMEHYNKHGYSECDDYDGKSGYDGYGGYDGKSGYDGYGGYDGKSGYDGSSSYGR